MPTGRWPDAAAVVDGLIYIMGEQINIGTPTQAVEVYDPSTNTWTKKPDRPAWTSGRAETINGQIYLFAFTVASYNPKTEVWTREPDMPTGRVYPSISVVNGRIYAIGGSLGWDSPGLSAVEEFTPNLPGAAVSPRGKLPALWGTLKVSR
jgi:N-acetylneuraminic acid mutarotase